MPPHAAHATAAHATAAHATAAHATTHAAELAGRTLSDDAGGQNHAKFTVGTVSQAHGHATITRSLGLDGHRPLTHGVEKADVRNVLVWFVLGGVRPSRCLLAVCRRLGRSAGERQHEKNTSRQERREQTNQLSHQC